VLSQYECCNSKRILKGSFNKISKNGYCLRHVSQSVSACLSTWSNSSPILRNFKEIRYLSIFRKSVEKIQVSLQSDKNNGYFIWRPVYINDNILLSSSYTEKCFRQTWYRKSKQAFYVQQIFTENLTVFKVLLKNIYNFKTI